MACCILFLLIIIPSATAFVDCRTACRTCRENKVGQEVLEVHCSMCTECKQKRRERMQELGSSVRFRKSETEQVQVVTATQFTNTPVIPEGCPEQPPCPDSEEYPFQIYLAPPTLAIVSITTKTTTTTTTTTTTKKPCPTFKPCKKRIPLPWLAPPMPPPRPPPPLHPNCYLPVQMQPMGCPGYPYPGNMAYMGPMNNMGPLGPMGHMGSMVPMPPVAPMRTMDIMNNVGSMGNVGPMGNMDLMSMGLRGNMLPPAILKPKNNHPRFLDDSSYDKVQKGAKRPSDNVEIQHPYVRSAENQGFTKQDTTALSGDSYLGTSATKDDYLYMYVGVPKGILNR